jgi:hypothetical protein
MKLEYVPLLPVQRQLHAILRSEKWNGKFRRFLQYLPTITNQDGTALEFPPLGAGPARRAACRERLGGLPRIEN